MQSRLTSLQLRVLELLADASFEWTLTRGGALAGFHCGHRTTRDLDLFLHGRARLEGEERACREILEAAGLPTSVIQRSPAFLRLQVRDGDEALVVDIVAEPVPFVEAPARARVGARTIRVDTPREILANKLGALIQRSELRDLVDLEVLLAAGGDLAQALRDAGGKDGGFSPLAVGWALANFDVRTQAALGGLDAARIAALESFRDRLAGEVAKLTRA
jgi:hypothetical protein